MIYVLLPAYNEEKGIDEVLNKLKAMSASTHEPLRIVVVDDGSVDMTSEVVLKHQTDLDIKLFRFEKNKGVTEVFKKGFSYIAEDSLDPVGDICICLDSDNTQDAYTFIPMIQA